MVDIGARVVRAGVAVTALLKGTQVGPERRAHNVVASIPRINGAVAACARRSDAVESVTAVLHAGKDIVHSSDTQYMARLVIRQLVANPIANFAHDALLERAAQTKAIKVKIINLRI